LCLRAAWAKSKHRTTAEALPAAPETEKRVIIATGSYTGELLDDVRAAFEQGVTFFDTAEAYGPFKNEELLGRSPRPDARSGRYRD
jgi:aryl-alcohol dehydrogenase-like predicted oxidoreductase